MHFSHLSAVPVLIFYILKCRWIIRFQIRKSQTKFPRQKRPPVRKNRTTLRQTDIMRQKKNKNLLVKIWRGSLASPTSPREQR